MAVAKLKVSNSTDVMKADEGNDSIDTFIRQAMGKEPFISFSRAGDSPVQWIQLLHALDQPDLPGWPLLTPLKIQMQKCEKCSREFCSSINYRRHIRVHHRSRKLDKDSNPNRELLGAFWKKLSEDEVKEILSFKVELQGVSGSSIVKSLVALVRRPGFYALPQHCLRAGSALLEIIQSRPSKFPLTSEELFSILDDASEKTFLCGAAASVQNFIFDGDAGKIGLETKNVVAFTSFLVEQKLVEAWLADKDAEALRCQNLLMEEEEAARRRQVEILEKKRQKKLRQKEQKTREQREDEVDVDDRIDETHNAVPPAEQPCTSIESDSDAHDPETSSVYRSSLAPLKVANSGGDLGMEIDPETSDGDADVGTGHVDRQILQVNNRRHVIARWQIAAKLHSRHLPNGFRSNQGHQTPKVNSSLRHGSQWELKSLPTGNSRRWNRKHKADNGEESVETEVQKESVSQQDNKECKVLIGSISVALGNSKHRASNYLDCANEHSSTEHQTPQDVLKVRRDVVNSTQSGATRSTVKLWRPVSRNRTGPMPVGIRECHTDDLSSKTEDVNPISADGIESCYVDVSYCQAGTLDESLNPKNMQFSCREAKAFLAERWKEAIAANHVKLVLTPLSKPSELSEENGCEVPAAKISDLKVPIVGNAENHLVDITHGSSKAGTGKNKFKAMPEKGVKLKYIPKQKAIT